MCPSRSLSLIEGARDGFGERKEEGWGRDAFPGKALPIRRVSVDKRDLASSSLTRVPLFFLPSPSYLNRLIVRGLHALQVTPGEGRGEAAAPSSPHVVSILPLTCSSYLGQTGDAGRKERNRGKGSQVMSAPRNLTGVAGLSRGTIPHLLPKFPFRWQQPRCAFSPATGGHRAGPAPGPAGGSRASVGPWSGPLSLTTPAAVTRGNHKDPGGRDARASPRSQDDPGGRLQACGTTPRIQLSPSIPAQRSARSPRLPGTSGHPTPPRAHWPAPPATPPRPPRLRGRLGPPAADSCC